MADDSGPTGLSTAHQNSNTMWKRKFITLQRRCEQIEQENERILNRLYHVNKQLGRYRRQRRQSTCILFLILRFLREKLDEHNDGYRNAQPPLQSQLMAEIVSESIPTFMNFAHGEPVSPGQTSNVTSSSQRKNKSRNSAKQDQKEKDPNAPKKPANAFFMFCQQQRNIMQEDQRDAAAAMGHHELTKTLAKEWNNLIEDEKKVYYEMYEKDKGRYEQEMRKYTSDKGPTKNNSTKKQKSKSKKGKNAAHNKASASAIVHSCVESRSGLVVSPTLNPLSPQSLISVPFNLPLIPSPTLPPTDKDAFQEFGQLPSPTHDSFMET